MAMRALLVRLSRQGRVASRGRATPPAPVASAVRLAKLQASQGVRAWSSKGVNGVNGDHGDEWDDELPVNGEANGELSPFERLLQHSRQFRDEVGMEDLPEGVDEEILGEQLREDDEEPLEEDDRHDRRSDRDGNDEDLESALDEREDGHAEFMGQIRKPRGHHHRSHAHGDEPRSSRPHRQNRNAKRWGIEQRVHQRIGQAQDVDFEHGLRDLDVRHAKDKMYVQLLARTYDRDRVCMNCGERGHVAQNCMLPVICSSCGDVGHRRNECPHRFYNPEQLTATKSNKHDHSSKKAAQQAAEARRRAELEAIGERHDRMKKAFDDELDEYLDHYEANAKTRKARKESEEQD